MRLCRRTQEDALPMNASRPYPLHASSAIRSGVTARPLARLCGWLVFLAALSAPIDTFAQTRVYELSQFVLDRTSRNFVEHRAAVNRARLMGMPVERTLRSGRRISLQKFVHGRPLYYTSENFDAADTVSADEVHPAGSLGLALDGAGQTLGIWDAGNVRDTHQELVGRVLNFDSAGLSSHATHVAGTLIGQGFNPNARGMSFAGDLIAYDFNGDEVEMAAEQLLAAPINVSNHSYSFVGGWIFGFFGDGRWAWFGDVQVSTQEDWIFGFYLQNAADWDQIAFDSPNYLMVKSAGNDRNDNGPTPGAEHWHYDNLVGNFVLSTDIHPADGGTTGYDSIGGGSASSKNILTVGAVNDITGGYSTPADVNLTSFTGWGPTDDGRIKPDLVANGTVLFSSVASSDTAYSNFSGTSMSSPNAAGSVGLLNQHAEALFGLGFVSSTMKALIIHTADEAGPAPGPDYMNGSGLLNVATAATLLSAHDAATITDHIVEFDLLDSETALFTFESDGNTPFRATIAWTDPPGVPPLGALDPPDIMLVNDIDLRVIGPGAVTFEPWILDSSTPSNDAATGDNIRDTVEQVHIAAPIAGTYTVDVRHKSVLATGSQVVSLVVSGNLDAAMIPPTITSTASTTAAVAAAYAYDADGTVNATGSTPLTFLLVTWPAGMSVSTGGLVSWTPTQGQEGLHPVDIQVQNAFGVDLQSFIIDVSEASPILLSDDFGDGDFAGWSVVDEGTTSPSSSWSASSGIMVESSNIFSFPADAASLAKLGTYAQYDAGVSWTDYRVSLTLRSTDNDVLGLMFRVQGSNDYYRFSWDQQRPNRRLVKNVGGVFSVLAEDSVTYVTGQTYAVEITAQGTSIEVRVDGGLVFSVTNGDLSAGTIALYSWATRKAASMMSWSRS